MEHAQQLLNKLGFGTYEARAYIALLGTGAANGYTVAKAAAMPRANVYAVLAKLVERGAVERLDAPDGVRYQALAPNRLVRHLSRQHQSTLTAAKKALNPLSHAAPESVVINLDGYEPLLARARELIDAADKSLRIAVQPQEAGQLQETLAKARDRGVAITTLCMEACPQPCGGCQGELHRYDIRAADVPRWLVVVNDKTHMVAAEISPAATHGLTTRRRLVVDLADAYICQSVALALVAENAGDAFDGLLSEKAQQVLSQVQRHMASIFM